MNSKRVRLALAAMSVLLLSSCTEKLPFEEQYSTDRSSVSYYCSVVRSDYRRVQLHIWQPTLAVARGVESVFVQARQGSTGDFENIDTLNWFEPPGAGYEWGYFLYESGPVFDYETEYRVRYLVRYRDGTDQLSRETYFFTPPERGRVLRRIGAPISFSNDCLAADGGKIYIVDGVGLEDGQLLQVDTASENTVQLLNNVFQTLGFEVSSLAALNDTLYFFHQISPDSATIVQLAVNTLQARTGPAFSTSGRYFHAITRHGGSLAIWYILNGGRWKFEYLDPATSQVLWSSADVSAEYGSVYPKVFASDGTRLWTGSYNYTVLTNRNFGFDPAAPSNVEIDRNPIYDPDGLAWDGTHFWVIDCETLSLAEIVFEGL